MNHPEFPPNSFREMKKYHELPWVFLPSPGTLENKPGCNAEQTLEALVNGELGRIRDLVGGAEEENAGEVSPVTLDRHPFGPPFFLQRFFQGFL